MSDSDATSAPADPLPTQPVGSVPAPVPPVPPVSPGTSTPETSTTATSVRARPRGPLTRMGPWAPVAGGLLGVVLGVVAVIVLAGSATTFASRLSLVFLVVGLGLLGAAGTLLADEVRLLRWRTREAAARPAVWADTTASLLNGLTPARLLLLGAGFVLFLSAWVSTR